jgi:hypothetical protein
MMKRRQIYLDQEQTRELDRLAKRDRTTVSQVIRQAIDAYVAKDDPPPLERIEDHPMWRFVGSLDDSHGDKVTHGSTSVDDIYKGRTPF